jgi:hypothetical protein
MLVITADVHERASGVPQLLKAMGAQVEWRALTHGDYVVGPETVVERKTVAGLHVTLREGRFWHQMSKIRAVARWPYLVIEGSSLFRGPVRPKAVRGLCLSRIWVSRSSERKARATPLRGSWPSHHVGAKERSVIGRSMRSARNLEGCPHPKPP